MPNRIAITAEGVLLRRDLTSYPASVPIQEGLILAKMLGERMPLVVLSDHDLPSQVHYWLSVNRLNVVDVECRQPIVDDELSARDLHKKHILKVRQGGLWMLLCGDPTLATWAMDQSIATLLFASIRYLENIPGSMPWEEMAKVAAEHYKKAGISELQSNADSEYS